MGKRKKCGNCHITIIRDFGEGKIHLIQTFVNCKRQVPFERLVFYRKGHIMGLNKNYS